MDDVRLGIVVRALRRRRGWRQTDLAQRATVSQQTISVIERGHVDSVSIRALRRTLSVLEAEAQVDVRWRGGALDRLIDEAHAGLAAALVTRLRGFGWEVEVEVTYATYRDRGSIDVLAWRGMERALLVVEVKSAVTSAEATLRKQDEKVRVARQVALERSGWRAATVSRLLVLPETRTARRRLEAGGALLARSYPVTGAELRGWLRKPVGAAAGRMFLANTSASSSSRRIDRPRAIPGRRIRRGLSAGAESSGLIRVSSFDMHH